MYADYFKTLKWSRLYRELQGSDSVWRMLKNYVIAPALPLPVKRCFVRRFLKQKANWSHSQNVYCLADKKNKFHSFGQRFELLMLFGPYYSLWMESNPYVVLGGNYNVEYRHPFFDKRVVAFMLSLPPHYKRQGKTVKVLLREAFKGILPESIRLRRGKAEFTPIIEHQINDFFNDNDFDFCFLRRYGLYDKRIEKKQTNSFWKLCCVEQWLQTNFGE